METGHPRQLGKYTLVAEIARGGMGIVYLAHTGGLAGFRKVVVVKELKPEFADDPRFREMFFEEAKLAARLNHRNIVQTNEVGEDGRRVFMAMDYLEGCSLHILRKRFTGDRAPSVAAQLRVLAEMLAGLHYAHELTGYDDTPMGIVHRDVSPHNVFVTVDGQVKLLDFGVAKASDRESQTQAGVLKGRVAYMAPEQVTNEKIDRRVDIFAAGVIMREILTGTRLWEGSNELDTLRRLVTLDIPPFPETTAPSVPSELREICMTAMAPNRDARFRTAHEMRTLIEQHLARENPNLVSEVGTRIEAEFADRRKKLQALIEGQVTESSSPGELPRLAGAHLPGSSSNLSLTNMDEPRSRSASRTPGAVVSSQPDAKPETVSAPAPRSRTPLLLVLGIGAAIGVSLALVLGLSMRRHRGEPTEAKHEAPPSPSSAPVAAQTAQTAPAASQDAARTELVDVVIRATPANAQIFIDDVAVAENPFRARYPRSSTTHRVRVIAAGHQPKIEEITFEANVNVSLSLDRHGAGGGFAQREPSRAAAPTPREPSAAKSEPPTPSQPSNAHMDISPSGGKAPQRAIDPKNPYGGE